MTGRVVFRAASAALVAALAAIALAGCGGSSSEESQTEDWANGMCSALVDWTNSVKAAGENVSKGDLSKSSLQDATNAISDANKQLSDDLKSLGKPPTPTADEAKSSLQQLSKDLSAQVENIREALSGGGDITSAITAAGTAVQAMSKDLQDTSNQLQALSKDDTWSNAFKNSESCQKLSSG